MSIPIFFVTSRFHDGSETDQFLPAVDELDAIRRARWENDDLPVSVRVRPDKGGPIVATWANGSARGNA